ncbi:MAG: antirestriction protein ArdC, partial [Methanosarcinales archaeon]
KTLFHEFTHSTGASFLSGRAGIFDAPQLEQAAAYIQSWIKVLKNDSKMVIQAASEAQKAADCITGGV